MFLQTQGLLCKTGFDSQAQRPQVPVGRQAEAGGFVCLPGDSGTKPGTKLALASGRAV